MIGVFGSLYAAVYDTLQYEDNALPLVRYNEVSTSQ